MPRIIGSTLAVDETNAAAHSTPVPTHAVGDLLVLFVSQDDEDATLTPDADYTAIAEDGVNNGVIAQARFRIATAGEAAADTTSSISAEWASSIIAIRGINAANPINASDTATANSSSPTAPSVTTTVDGCLILRLLAFHGTGNLRPPPGARFSQGFKGSSSGDISLFTFFEFQRTAGATGTFAWNTYGTNERHVAMTVAIEDDGITGAGAEFSGGITYLDNLTGALQSTTLDTGTIAGSTVLTRTNLTSSGVGFNIFAGASRYAITSSPVTASVLRGGDFVPAAAYDLSAANALIGYNRAAEDQMHPVGTPGQVLVLHSGSDWHAYEVGGSNSKDPDQNWSSVVVAPSHTTNLVDSSGTLNTAAVDRITFLGAGSANRNSDIQGLFTIDPIVVTGGSANNPATFLDFVEYSRGAIVDIVRQQGETQIFTKASLQIGDGVTPTVFVDTGKSIELVPDYDANQNRVKSHINPNVLAVIIDLATGSTFDVSNTQFNSDNPYRFEFSTVDAMTAPGWQITNVGQWTFSGAVTLTGGVVASSAAVPSTGETWINTTLD